MSEDMEGRPGGWWTGTTEDFLNIAGPLDTREDAIEAGRESVPGERFYICRAEVHEWHVPDASIVIEGWIEEHYELWYDDDFPGFEGPNQLEREKAAQDDLQTVLNDWFERHKSMLPTATAFAWHADGEWIEPATPTKDQQS